MTDHLALKWGTLKGCDLTSDAAKIALAAYNEAGDVSISAMAHCDTVAQIDALCALIDAVDCDLIYMDWDGEYATKDRAKEYVRGYRR